MKNTIQTIILIILVSSQISCVQETREIAVTFEVDMSKVQNVSSVSIVGEFPPLSWKNQKLLTDENADEIFDATFTFDIPYDAIAYKYVLNGKQIELEGKANRRVFVKNQNSKIVRSVFDEQSHELIKPLSDH